MVFPRVDLNLPEGIILSPTYPQPGGHWGPWGPHGSPGPLGEVFPQCSRHGTDLRRERQRKLTEDQVSGWRLSHPSEKIEFVNSDDDYSQLNGKIKNVPNHQLDYPCAPWCWNIYLHDWAIFGVNAGKHSSTMEHMGYVKCL